MLKFLFFSFLVSSIMIVSIYSLSVTDIDNGSINFNNYRGKKILIVNTASGSPEVNQLAALQQLYLQHQDSMVIIAFPTNSFGNEPKSDMELKTFMQGTYGITFPIAAKSWVRGDSANIIYQWLGDKIQNDVMDGKTKRDFQKYLINSTGSIVAKFDSSVSPVSVVVQNAIHDN